jgi:negative regulator of sigma E activity
MRMLLFCSLAVFFTGAFAQHPPTRVGDGPQNDPPRSSQDGKLAKSLVRKTMSRQPSVNTRAIIMQRTDSRSGVMQQIKVEISKSGNLHQIVIAPTSSQGIELVDDGKTTRIFTPDDRKIIVQPSGCQDAQDIDFRMRLVDRNYNLKVLRRERVAGRDAIVVEASPRNSELETRCYSIDRETGFLLRLETCQQGRSPVLLFETKMVEFPSEFSDATFRLMPAGVVTQHYRPTSVAPESWNKLTSELGFRPVVPTSLPLGFSIQQLQCENDSAVPAVAIRVTDGLARATVYQWQRRGKSRGKIPEGTIARSAGTLTIMIAGDLPREVKERIIDSFVSSSRGERALGIPISAASWALELGCQINVFSLDKDCEGVGPTILTIPAWFRI